MASSGQTISLFFGDTSSHIGTHSLNIQHNLLNCAEQNDYLDVDQMFVERETATGLRSVDPMALFFNLNANNYSWNNFAKYKYPERSLCTVPIWRGSQPFDVCFQGHCKAGGAGGGGGDVEQCVGGELWEDGFLEAFRRTAERCDSLRTVSVTADTYSAFGGLSCAYLEALVDEMLSPSVDMTVACVTEDPVANFRAEDSSRLYNQRHRSSLQRLNTPFVVGTLTGLLCGESGSGGSRSVAVLPLDLTVLSGRLERQLRQVQETEQLQRIIEGGRAARRAVEAGEDKLQQRVLYASTLMAACGLETAMGCMRLAPRLEAEGGSGGGRGGGAEDEFDYDDCDVDDDEDEGEENAGPTVDSRVWLAEATSQGRHPLLHLEMHMPFSYGLTPPSSEPRSTAAKGRGDSGSTLLLKHIHDSCDAALGGGGSHRGGDGRGDNRTPPTRTYSYRTLNPFMNVTLSSATIANDAAASKQRLRDHGSAVPRVERPFSNVVSVRGATSAGLPSFLFEKCLRHSSYLLTAVHCRNASLPMDKSEASGLLAGMGCANRFSAATSVDDTTSAGGGSSSSDCRSSASDEYSPSAVDADWLVDCIWDAAGAGSYERTGSGGSGGGTYLYGSGMAAVGSDVRMGQWVGHLARVWATSTLPRSILGQLSSTVSSGSSRHQLSALDDASATEANSGNIRFQLGKYGYGTEDCEAMAEQLLGLRERYNGYSKEEDDELLRDCDDNDL